MKLYWRYKKDDGNWSWKPARLIWGGLEPNEYPSDIIPVLKEEEE